VTSMTVRDSCRWLPTRLANAGCTGPEFRFNGNRSLRHGGLVRRFVPEFVVLSLGEPVVPTTQD
jgi:hypothetical protein